MANWSIDGKTSSFDLRAERIAAGTVGDAHIQDASVGGRAAGQVITPLDPRVTYGGTWTIYTKFGYGRFLGYNAKSNTPGSNMTVQFNGTSIAIIGTNANYAGRYDVYIDGALAYGAVNTLTTLAAGYYPTPLSATATDVIVTDTTGLNSSGAIVIDGEEITYTAISSDGITLTGCTRGANGTTPATHVAGTTVYAANTAVEGYVAYQQERIIMWRKSNLSPGPHSLQLVLRTDKNASSSNYFQEIGGFMVGSALGASNVLTNERYTTITTTTNVSGITGAVGVTNIDSSQQRIAVLGCYPVSGCTTCYHMWKQDTGELVFVTNGASTTVTIAITYLFLGPTF